MKPPAQPGRRRLPTPDALPIQWDEDKRRAIFAKHGIDMLEAALILEGMTAEWLDDRHDYGEDRWIAIGLVDGRCYVVVYTMRDLRQRLITARREDEEIMGDIRTASLKEIRRMKERGELSPTRPDATKAELPDAFWDEAVLVEPGEKPTTVPLQAEVRAWFERTHGDDAARRMADVLADHVKAHEAV